VSGLIEPRHVRARDEAANSEPAAVQRKDPKGAKGGANISDTIAAEHKRYIGNMKGGFSTEAPTGYKVTVATSMEIPEYLKFAKTRMKSTIRNTVRQTVRQAPGMRSIVRKQKTGAAIKEKAAMKTAGKAADDPDVKHLIENSDSVGHAWIKLSPVGPSGPIQTYSFGFVPDDPAQAHKPEQAIPGRVRNPDLEFEYSGTHNLYQDTTVDAKSYLNALTKVKNLMGSPPSYKTIGYNCTAFTKEIARAAGASFPHEAGMMIPISDRGVMKRALSPNALYSKLQKGGGAQSTSKERDLLMDPSDKWGASDDEGIFEMPAATFAAPVIRGLTLFDLGSDEDIKVGRDELVIPTGVQMMAAIQVDYGGRQLYAENIEALYDHLEQQVPPDRSVYKLAGSLIVTGNNARQVTMASGTDVMVKFADGELTVSSKTAMGKCDLFDFWSAVGGF
jgi:hypothetical protein